MKITLFVVVGLVLLFTNIWYLRNLYRTFFDRAMPDVIAPIVYVGAEDKDGVNLDCAPDAEHGQRYRIPCAFSGKKYAQY